MRAVLQSSRLAPPHPRSRSASATILQPSHCRSARDADGFQGVTHSFTARPFARDNLATAHQLALAARVASFVPLGAAQQSHQLAPSPLARFLYASPTSLEPVVSRPSLESALPVLSTNSAVSPQSGFLLASLALTALSAASLPSVIQYAPQYLQTAPRVASTVVVPASQQPGTKSALFVLTLLQFEAAAVQPASQVAAPLNMGDHASKVGALLGMGAQPLQF